MQLTMEEIIVRPVFPARHVTSEGPALEFC